MARARAPAASWDKANNPCESSHNINMAPYSKKVKVVFDGKSFVPEEPLDLPINQEIEITVTWNEPSIIDERPLQEKLDALRKLRGRISYGKLTGEAFKRDENMNPDRW